MKPFNKNNLIFKRVIRHGNGKRGESTNYLIKIGRWKIKKKKNGDIVEKGLLIFSKAVKNIVGEYKVIELRYNEEKKMLGIVFLNEENEFTYKLGNQSKHKHKVLSYILMGFVPKEYQEDDCMYDSKNKMIVVNVEPSNAINIQKLDFEKPIINKKCKKGILI